MNYTLTFRKCDRPWWAKAIRSILFSEMHYSGRDCKKMWPQVKNLEDDILYEVSIIL